MDFRLEKVLKSVENKCSPCSSCVILLDSAITLSSEAHGVARETTLNSHMGKGQRRNGMGAVTCRGDLPGRGESWKASLQKGSVTS